jgi:hypothetical protein
MFCNKCGVENPTDAEFCYKCGKPLLTHPSQPEAQPPTTDTFAATADSAPSPSKSSSAQKWATAYGWLFVLAALYSWVVGLMALVAGQEGSPIADSKLSASGALLQALLFGVTGQAIIRNKKIAVVLLWATVALSGLGILFRGLTPLDTVL